MNGASPLIVDVDAHYYENPRGFAQYLDEPWRTTIASWSGQYLVPISSDMSSDNFVGGRIRRDGPGGRPTSRDGVLAAMRYVGTDVAVLLPSSMLHASAIKEPGVALALCNGFLDHMLDEVADPAAGLYTLAVVPDKSPVQAAELIRRAARHDAVCGAVTMPHGLAFPLGDRFYDPIYEACQATGLPLVVHSVGQGPWEFQTFQNFVEARLGFVLNAQIQLASIVLQGVPARFPGLRLAIEEAGVFWIAQMMYRLDMEYSMARVKFPCLDRPPSEYIRGLCFATQPLERAPQDHLEAVFRMIDGPSTLMYSSDWPHRDFDSPVAIRRLSFLTEAEKAQILGGNACRVMRFNCLGRPAAAGAARTSEG